MKNAKIIPILIGLLLLSAHSAFAFKYDGNLSEQLDTANGLYLNAEDDLSLEKSETLLKSIFLSPDYENDQLMYLAASDGIYVNYGFEASFNLDSKLSEFFPDGNYELRFEGNFKNTGYLLAHNHEDMYVSYNRGSSWNEISVLKDEDILFADFGPNFSGNQQIYFITESGLYRKSLSNYAETLVMASEEGEMVTHFAFYREQNSDSIFHVVKGNTVYRTENFGSSWFSHSFESGIKDFDVKSENQGDLMVLTNDNKIFYASNSLNFYQLTLPQEITQIYSADYVMNTDAGFYITYNWGSSWSKLNYLEISDTGMGTDYVFTTKGNQTLLYLIYENVLYRDLSINGQLSEYMTGIDFQAEYTPQGEAVSKNILDLYADNFAENYLVDGATLSADGDLNGQTMTFYMTADGENWEEVVLDESVEFENPGRDLRWKVVMATQDTAVSPVLRSVSVNFGFLETEPPVDETICAGFPDVPANDPLCPAIAYVKEQGIFAGYPDGDFRADQAINRAETVKVVTEGFSIPLMEDNGTTLGFSDVIVGEWYMGYLRTAKESGVIEGYPDGTFKPEQTVNYVEMLKIFLETAEAQLPGEGAEWYSKYVAYAQANGLVTYTQLDAGMKRGDVAQLFYQWSLR